jgi:hypothetical protein
VLAARLQPVGGVVLVIGLGPVIAPFGGFKGAHTSHNSGALLVPEILAPCRQAGRQAGQARRRAGCEAGIGIESDWQAGREGQALGEASRRAGNGQAGWLAAGAAAQVKVSPQFFD